MLYWQIAHALTEIIHTHATTLTKVEQWYVLFSMLEFVVIGTTSSTPSTASADSYVASNGSAPEGGSSSRPTCLIGCCRMAVFNQN